MKIIGLSLIAIASHFSLHSQHLEIKKVQSSILNQERTLHIYTPWQYEEFPDKKLEVVYVFDAQARQMFDNVHSSLQFMGGQEFAFIVVGIESPFIEEQMQSRNTDFLPEPQHQETKERFQGFVGNADNFLRYVGEEVIPFVDENYRTLPTRVAVGHSNGGTFLFYTLIEQPELFDAYIAVSPNFKYDKNQMVDRLQRADLQALKTPKFVFMSIANEGGFWTDWGEAYAQSLTILQSDPFDQKIHLVTADFSESENHSTTFPLGAFNGLKSYINYQFRTGEQVIAYYDRLSEVGAIELNPDNTNIMAYECFWNGRPAEGLAVIQWAIARFPEDHNLLDSQGEMYENLEDYQRASASFTKALEVLKQSKDDLDESTYKEKEEFYSDNLKRVNDKLNQ